ncbi:MAG TPA: adenylosuccinate synthase [Dehalococcoidales bacterium]|nr:adenylosuccinate synthase [Dehalococcoidales bacterium]
MPVLAVIGAQWGDEGKGKVVDMLAERAKVVVRFSGGDNAGHTVINPYGKFGLHLVPCGIFYPETTCIIGNGVAINPAILIKEIDLLNKHGVNTKNLFISDRANLIMPYHVLLDKLEEESRGENAIGTTLRGIGPVYADKVARRGIRAGELLDEKAFRERLRMILEYKNVVLTKVYGAKPLSLDEVYDEYCRYAERLAPHIRETTAMIDKAIQRNLPVLLEGAQGTLLDPDFGTYPYATCSSPLAGGASIGAGIGPTKIDAVLGVFKAYVTRVGAGPFPSELKDKIGESIRERGHEFGTTTGRPRSCGWFDTVAARFSTRINGFTTAAITRLDVLDGFPSLKICTGYKLGNKKVDDFPSRIDVLEKCQPVYEELPGWQAPVSDVRQFNDLPAEARRYVTRLEELIDCPVSIISVGPSREQTIEVTPLVAHGLFP